MRTNEQIVKMREDSAKWFDSLTSNEQQNIILTEIIKKSWFEELQNEDEIIMNAYAKEKNIKIE